MKITELLVEAPAKKAAKPVAPTSNLTISFKENNTKNGIVMMKSTPGQDPREFMTFYPGEGSNKVYAVMLKHLQDNPNNTVTLNIPKKPLAKKYETVFRGLIPYVNSKDPKDKLNLPDKQAVLNQMGGYMTDRLTLNYDGDMSGIPRTMEVLRRGERPAPGQQASQAPVQSQPSAQLVEFVIEPWQWFSAIVKSNLFGMNDYLRKFNRLEVPDGKYVNRFVVTARDFERIKQRLTDVNFVARVQNRLRGPGSTAEDRRIPIVPKLVVVPSTGGGIFEATGDEKFDSMLKDIVTPPKPGIFKRIRGFLTPDVDKTAREHYESLAASWSRVANHFYELYKQLPEDHPRYQIAKSKWEYAMGHRVLYDMLSGRRNYDEQLARMIQQRYKIDPRDKLPSI